MDGSMGMIEAMQDEGGDAPMMCSAKPPTCEDHCTYSAECYMPPDMDMTLQAEWDWQPCWDCYDNCWCNSLPIYGEWIEVQPYVDPWATNTTTMADPGHTYWEIAEHGLCPEHIP